MQTRIESKAIYYFAYYMLIGIKIYLRKTSMLSKVLKNTVNNADK